VEERTHHSKFKKKQINFFIQKIHLTGFAVDGRGGSGGGRCAESIGGGGGIVIVLIKGTGC
jgi:hypothetical protein